jgi:NAD(P)H-dependent FMN reductase
MSHATPLDFLFLVSSTRVPGVLGNTEALARRAAAGLPAGTSQGWEYLAQLALPPFVDHRHDIGSYPMPEGEPRRLLDATMAASDIVLVAPVYWFSLPANLKHYLEYWSAWLRVPGLDFKARMAGKRLWLVTTSGNRDKAQPSIDSARLCAEFMSMEWRGALWGKGGAPGAVEQDALAWAQAERWLADLPQLVG